MLRAYIADQHGLPHNFFILSDSHTILERVKEDDEKGGFHHYHSWDPEKKLGHTHEDHPDIIPFTLAGNGIAHDFIADFFREFADAPFNGMIRYAEWSGGINTNDRSDPASRTDLSFARIGSMLKDGSISPEGLDRVLAVLHVSTPTKYRIMLNDGRSIPSEDEIRCGTASWPLDEPAMRIFGEDDFMEGAVDVLREHDIPLIETLHNNLQGSLGRELRVVLPDIIALWGGGENGRPASTQDRDRR
jgi:hypothetical protein